MPNTLSYESQSTINAHVYWDMRWCSEGNVVDIVTYTYSVKPKTKCALHISYAVFTSVHIFLFRLNHSLKRPDFYSLKFEELRMFKIKLLTHTYINVFWKADMYNVVSVFVNCMLCLIGSTFYLLVYLLGILHRIPKNISFIRQWPTK